MNVDKTQLLSGASSPESYYCTVWLQTAHHSEMAVRIMSTLDETPTTQKFYWVFTGVVYYSGPLKWQNADFTLDVNNRVDIIKKIYPTININNLDDLLSKDFYRLFKFIDNISSLEIKILASGIVRLENLP
jgi:hypothetical protein